ncbi:hypothetical protein A2Z22_04895 [Candidatus Woesebacteria bacterium RBG_16_34_12]|uniref:Uncharacterized protein n=1 Tax=Candidatus Woesebacteria bacterium RBG_16_34_12 TaxID=1802480 RepID=A0A1F7XAC7_9BACT|nr:MAG: hypothetical protein A2Z22_04895 [Candidatus Woesebacteria bacterium RBG_16_34_12]
MSIEIIENQQGDILPFSRIRLSSPRQAQETGVIAHGEIEHPTYEKRGVFIYLGSEEVFDRLPDSWLQLGKDRYIGLVINHGEPVGSNKAVVRKVEFPGESVVYISKGGQIPGCGRNGVWLRVGDLKEDLEKAVISKYQ